MTTLAVRESTQDQATGGSPSVNARAAAANANLRFFWLACAVTLVVSHYSLATAARFPWVYRVMAVLITLLTPFTAGFGSLLQQRPVQLLILFEAVLVIGSVVGYSGTLSNLWSTNSEPIVWLRAFPFLLCGYTLSLWPKSERRWIAWTAALMAILVLPDIYNFVRGSAAGLGREDIYIDERSGERIVGIVTQYVNLAPACLFLAIFAMRTFDGVADRRTRVAMIAMIPLLTVPLVAGFTAQALLFLVASALAILLVPVRNLGYRLQVGAIGVLGIVVVWAALSCGGKTFGGAVGQVHNRLEALRNAVIARELTKDTNVATSGRIELARRSLDSFLSNPLFGVGGGDWDERVGGHSFLVDTLARFGIVGGLPVFAALLGLLLRALRTRRRSRFPWASAAMAIFMLTWCIALFINPYFLGHLTLNYVVFLGFGLVMGDYVFRTTGSAPTRLPGQVAGTTEYAMDESRRASQGTTLVPMDARNQSRCAS